MVLKATEQRGQVPWQETLVPKGIANWKVGMHSLAPVVLLSSAEVQQGGGGWGGNGERGLSACSIGNGECADCTK